MRVRSELGVSDRQQLAVPCAQFAFLNPFWIVVQASGDEPHSHCGAIFAMCFPPRLPG